MGTYSIDNPYAQKTVPPIKPDVTTVSPDNPYRNYQQNNQEPGFWSKLSNFAENAHALINPLDPNPARIQLFSNIATANEDGKAKQAAALAGHDLLNTFTTEKGITQLGSDFLGGIKDAFTNIKDDPTGTITSLPSGLFSMATTPFNALVGVDLTAPDGRALNPEERAQAIKDTAGQIALFMATKGAGNLTEAAGLGAKTGTLAALKTASEADLATAAATNVGRVSNYAKTLSRNLIAAGSGGAAYGLVSGAGDENQAAKVASTMVMFLPLGAVAGAIGMRGELAETRNVVDLAKNIQAYRALNFKLNDTIKSLDTKVESIVSSDNLADAVLTNQIKKGSIRPVIVEGVTASKLDNIPSPRTVPKTPPLAEASKQANEYYGNDAPLRSAFIDGFNSGDSRFSDPFTSAVVKESKTPNNPYREGTPQWLAWKQGYDNSSKLKPIADNPISSEAQELKYNVVRRNYDKKNDTADVLLYPKDSPVDASSFINSGYLRGEMVSYQGKDYIIDITSPKDASLKGPGGAITVAPLKDIRRVSQDIIYDPKKLLDQEYDALVKGITKGEIGDANFDKLSAAFQNLEPVKQVYFSQKLAHDVVLQDTKGNFPALDKLNEFYIRNTAPKEIGTIEQFIDHAQTNGYAVDISDAGKVILRDMNDDKRGVVGEGRNLEEATKLLNGSGQVPGTELVSPFISAKTVKNLGEPVNLNRPERIPFLQSPLAWAKNKVDWLDYTWKKINNVGDYTFHWFTPANDLFKAMDNRFGTRFHALFFDQTQQAKQSALSAADPYVKKLGAINKAALKYGLKASDLEHVMNYIETASPETIIKEGFSRPMNPQEVAIAKLLDDNEAIAKAFKVREWKRNNPSPKPGAFEAFVDGVGIDEKALRFSDFMDGLFKMNPEEVDGGMVIRLARAINDKSVDKPEYAKLNNLDQRHIDIAKKIQDLAKEMGSVFEIDDKDMMNHWMTHARLYTAGDMQAALNLFARDRNPKANPFYGELARTGEVDTYERNPITAMYRYITAGFNARNYNNAEAIAKKYLENVMGSNMVPDAEKAKVRAVAEGYLNDLRGRTPIMSVATEAALNSYLSDLEQPTGIRRGISEALKAVQVGTQGFKPGAGIRDFMNATGFIYYRYGAAKLERVLRYGLEEHRNGDALIKDGKLVGLTLDRLANPSELEGASRVIKTSPKDAWDQFGALSLKASGQDLVYNLIRQGMYRDTYNIIADASRKLVGGKIDRAQFYKDIGLDRDYSQGIAAEVRRQIEQTSPVRYDKVAEYLSRESARHVTPSYGLGNNPSGWGRNIGRIVGQYGSYSAWALHALKEPLMNGTYGERLGKALRYGIYTGAIMSANNLTGYNFSPWYIHRVGFMGGPLAQTGLNMYNAIFGSGYEATNAQDELKRMLPYDGENFHKQFYLPGSFAISDLLQSIDEGNPLPFLGVKPQP